jgi:hypothetical protein
MPKVAVPAVSVTPSKVEIVHITQKQLAEFSQVSETFNKANTAFNTAKKPYEQMTKAILCAALGFKDSEDIRTLTPKEVETLLQERLQKGLVTFEGGALDVLFAASEPNGRKNPSYKDILQAEKGEQFVLDAIANTPATFSYKVVIIQDAK